MSESDQQGRISREDEEQLFNKALVSFRKLLKFAHSPLEKRDMSYENGSTRYKYGEFDQACPYLILAHEAVEELRLQVKQVDMKREVEIINVRLYAILIHCCLECQKYEEAFQYAASGKGRIFVDMLATSRFNVSEFSKKDKNFGDDWQSYLRLVHKIDRLQIQLNQPSLKRVARERSEKKLESFLEEQAVCWQELTKKYPTLTATQSAPSLSATQAKALAAEVEATLVEFVQHAGGWSAFVVTPKSVRYVPLPKVNDKFLQEKLLQWLIRIENPALHNEASYWYLDDWYEALITPLKPHLPAENKGDLPSESKVVFAPAGALHLMPLSIARNPETERYLCHEYTIAFSPSMGALRVTLEQAKKKDRPIQKGISALLHRGAQALKSVGFKVLRSPSKEPLSDGSTRQTVLIAAYPGEPDSRTYLHHVMPEAEAIAEHFPHVTSLYQKAATPQAVLAHADGHDVIHIGCHAGFNPEWPSQSGFKLCGGHLTIQRIITELHLKDTRLATLSGCLTHRVALEAGNEQMGLVQAVMIAGAQAVVASLWKVPDKATHVLFQQFYRALATKKSPARALQEAIRFVQQEPDWEHPYYWAAFQVSGLAYDLQM